MANLNRVFLIGRLTRDPEVRVFPSGGKVAKFGFAVNNRRKNASTGQWEDEPVFLDVEAFNRGEFNKLADRIEETLTKGRQVFIEGHLRLDQWTDKEGQKRQKLVIVCDGFQYLDPRPEGQAEGGGRPAAAGRKPQPQPADDFEEPAEVDDGFDMPDDSGDREIPF
jgi:single-strand DNA-binding protein